MECVSPKVKDGAGVISRTCPVEKFHCAMGPLLCMCMSMYLRKGSSASRAWSCHLSCLSVTSGSQDALQDALEVLMHDSLPLPSLPGGLKRLLEKKLHHAGSVTAVGVNRGSCPDLGSLHGCRDFKSISHLSNRTITVAQHVDRTLYSACCLQKAKRCQRTPELLDSCTIRGRVQRRLYICSMIACFIRSDIGTAMVE